MRDRLLRFDAALSRWLNKEWPWLRWLLLVLALGVVVTVLWPLPAFLTRHPSYRLAAADRLKATNDVRTTLVQTLAGLAVLGGLVFTARTIRLTREGQLTDRYTKAIEQLGSSTLDCRLGGIYALERVMVDSERDHPTIVEVLADFLREHATAPAKEQGDLPAPMPADTAAAAAVIAQRPPGRDERGRRLDLRRCYLVRANLSGVSGANLADAVLSGANLSGAYLSRANLPDAHLFQANLSGAYLVGADLSRANLSHANLFAANLSRANLSGANLSHTVLSGAVLAGADLSGANLSRAVLVGAMHLTCEQLTGVANTEKALLPRHLAAKDTGWPS